MRGPERPFHPLERQKQQTKKNRMKKEIKEKWSLDKCGRAEIDRQKGNKKGSKKSLKGRRNQAE